MTGSRVAIDLDLDVDAADWDALADRAGVTPFQRPGWIQAWWNAFRPGSPDALRVVGVRAPDGRLAGVLPLYHRRGVLHAPTNHYTPMFDPVAEESFAVDLAHVALSRPVPRIALAYLLARRPDPDEWEAAAKASGWKVLTRVFERSPYIDLVGDFRSYEAALPGKLRADLRRRRRRLEEAGQVTVDIADGRRDLDELLAQGFDVEGSGWKGESGTSTAIAASADTRQFYTDIAHWAGARGWLRLCFLRVDGRPVAFAYCIEQGGAFYLMKQGYDERWARFAPGKLLVRETIEHAFTAGLKTYEFLGHNEPFKLEWTSEVRELLLLHAFGPTAAGRAQWAAYRYIRPLAVRLRLRP